MNILKHIITFLFLCTCVLRAQPLLTPPDLPPSPMDAETDEEPLVINPVDIPEEVMEKVDPSVVSIQHEYAGGTGFIISEDGYILSNGHVVLGNDPEQPTEPAKRITVILSDDRKFSAEVLGFSMDPDVALLKIDTPDPLKPVTFANSRKAQVGQRCFAVGTPVGLKRTFTSGILSNITRTDLGTETVVFQTDAAINSGNSGGPLFDSKGHVLGVNTYASRGQNNLGFTIPIHVVEDMIEDLKTRGRFVRSLVPLFFTNELYDELQKALQVEEGILISYVMEDSSAEKMGMKAGDILVKVDGEPVSATSQAELLDFEWEQTVRPAGESVIYTVMRGEPGARKEIELKGTLEEFELFPAFNRHVGEIPEHRYATLGLGLERQTSLHKIIHEIPPDVSGVFVKTVEDSSVASRAEIRPGDIITSFGGKKVKTMAQARKVLDHHLAKREKAIPVTIRRGKFELITALAPDYLMNKRKVLLVVPHGGSPDLDVIHRELLAKGAEVTLVSKDKESLPREEGLPPLNAHIALKDLNEQKDVDILMFAGGEGAEDFWENEVVLKAVRNALEDEEMVLACIGESTLLPVLATEEKLEPKLTLPPDLSGRAVMRGANYTGKEVEEEKMLVTTTGAERDILREFLQAVSNQY